MSYRKFYLYFFLINVYLLTSLHSDTHSDTLFYSEDGKQPSNSDTWGLNYTSARDKCWKKDKILKPVGMCSNGSWVRSWTSAFRVDIKVKYHKGISTIL